MSKQLIAGSEFFPDSGDEGKPHTVDDSTNDLMDLSMAGGISAGVPSRESAESIALKWLEGRLEGRRRSGKSGPSEGPGNTATDRRKNQLADAIRKGI